MEPIKVEVTIKHEATGILGALLKKLMDDSGGASTESEMKAVKAEPEAVEEAPKKGTRSKKVTPVDTSLATVVASGSKPAADDDDAADDADDEAPHIGIDDLKNAAAFLVDHDGGGRDALKAMLQKRYEVSNITKVPVDKRADALARIERLTQQQKDRDAEDED